MDKYELVNQIGDGTFGSVAKAVLKKTGQLVAVKKMKQKFYTWEECVKLPEVDVVRRIHGHPNVVKLREVIRENNELFFVFEFMDGDLLGVIKKAKLSAGPGGGLTSPYIPYAQIRSYMRQVMQALAYVHKRGYFHRDLKPENLLIRKEPTGEEVVKLADFGLVKEVRSRPPFTDYVSTRWYRAPELLLQDRYYGTAVDIWAAGCIMVELITTRPLFPGSNEVDQLFKIMSVLGAPTERTWPGGLQLAKKIRYTFPSITGTGLAQVLPVHTPAAALDLATQMLAYDPKTRLTAEQCLHHPFLAGGAEEASRPSAAVLEQLSVAAKRLPTGPQSAPPPLKGPVVAEAASPQKAGCATADGPFASESPRKLHTLARPAESTAVTFPGVSAAAGGRPALPELSKSPAVEPVPLPSLAAPGAKRRSQESGGSSIAKKLAGLKNAHGVNGRRPSHVTATAKALPSLGNGAALPPAPSVPLSARSGASLSVASSGPTGQRETKPLKMTVAQPLHRRPSKEADSSLPLTLSLSKRDVTLDDLMEEFAAEMPNVGLHAERRESNGKATGSSSLDAALEQDSVAALLSSSRFKKTASVANEPSSLQALKASGATRTTLLARGRKTDDGTGGTELPRVEQANKGVSPSLKALLAKHKTSAFAYQ